MNLFLLQSLTLLIFQFVRAEIEEQTLHCKNFMSPVFMNFDEIILTGSSQILERPYKEFILKGQNTARINHAYDTITVMNTSNAISLYRGSASSEPNVILTTGENLIITRSEKGGLFGIRSLTMATIYLDRISMNVDSFKSGRPRNHQTIILESGKHSLVSMQWDNIDTIVIGCRQTSECSHIVYDNFILCPSS